MTTERLTVAHPGLQHGWHIYTQTTDRGSNEVATRAILERLYHQSGKHVLFFGMDCCEHSVHLMVMGSLAEIEMLLAENNFKLKKYFSSCAVLANVLRESSRDLFRVWMKLYGVHEALQTVRTLFPKCISGRWGSVHAFEQRVLRCGEK